jgi:hypothetical protein
MKFDRLITYVSQKFAAYIFRLEESDLKVQAEGFSEV